MWYLSVVFLVLVFFPLIVALLFRRPLVQRKQREIWAELGKLCAHESEFVGAWGGQKGITESIEAYYSPTSLLVPAGLLTFLYSACFLLSWSYLNVSLNEGSPWPFSGGLLDATAPILMAFVGVYLFNMGSTVRRLYVSDLSEHVFWSSLNRLLLTIGLAVVVSTAFPVGGESSRTYFLFFAIGFLANIFLRLVMEGAMRIADIRKGHTRELSLQMIQGINMWKEFRLEEEGIENVQNLATADLIELVLKTHYNLRTLLDWIDQAVLLDRLGEKARKLAEEGLIAGAIDFAWLSPANNSGDTTTAKFVSEKLGLEQHFVEMLMNNLYEDAYVQNLWTLWQTQQEVQLPGKASAA